LNPEPSSLVFNRQYEKAGEKKHGGSEASRRKRSTPPLSDCEIMDLSRQPKMTKNDDTANITEATHRTFRIRMIDESVTTSQLHEWLKTLEFPSVDSSKVVDDNVVEFSLIPSYDGSKTATVTFFHTPLMFIPCKPGRDISNHDIGHVIIGGIKHNRLVIDCDFYGMTPVYICAQPEPSVEFVASQFVVE
jgi:hypothetical protein